MYFKKCLHSHFPLEFIYAFVSLGLHKSTKLPLLAVLFIYSPVCSSYFLCILPSLFVHCGSGSCEGCHLEPSVVSLLYC